MIMMVVGEKQISSVVLFCGLFCLGCHVLLFRRAGCTVLFLFGNMLNGDGC